MSQCVRKVLVTGSRGFIGRNLVVALRESGNHEIYEFNRGDDEARLFELIEMSDVIVHLAGENRPKDIADFQRVNAGLTATICNFLAKSGGSANLILSSSTQAVLDNDYGKSKLEAEKIVEQLSVSTGCNVTVFRLPGVFGKWCKPNYNSVVATFCHNIARGLPVRVDNPEAVLNLSYVDDVVSDIKRAIDNPVNGYSIATSSIINTLTLGRLKELIEGYHNDRTSLKCGKVGTGVERALYATYVSYLPTDNFSYTVPGYSDPRGCFVEMLKTPESGQFSFFTAHQGVTRGGHYHHTKTEKFLVIKGTALFRFRNIITDELVELKASGEKPTVVDTIPGWVHDITNIGDDEMIVMLWANEIFDRARPDTIAAKVML